MKRPIVVGVVGGVASGKSEVTRHLERLGARVIHADAFGHEVLQEPDVIDALTGRFGPAILQSDSLQIDRSRVAGLVFGSEPQALENRRFLESIVHPRIRVRIRESLDRAVLDDRLAVVVLDVPLLIESGWIDHCDRVLFVDAPPEVRRTRALQRGWSEDQFAAREAAQIDIESKRASATETIDNSGTLETLRQQVEQWWRTVTAP